MSQTYFNKRAAEQIGIAPNAAKVVYIGITQPVSKELSDIYVSVLAGVSPLVLPAYYQVRLWVCTQQGRFDDVGLSANLVSPLNPLPVNENPAIGDLGDILFEGIVTCNPSYEVTFSKPLRVEGVTKLFVCASYSVANGETDLTAASRYVSLSANGQIADSVVLNYKAR